MLKGNENDRSRK